MMMAGVQQKLLPGLKRKLDFFALEAIFLALLVVTSVTSISSCPRKCQCIWRDSKITVDCSDQDLAAIPTTVEANTQVLNISGNNVPLLGRRHFARLGLTNLQRIAASRCGLVQIDSLAFIGLTNLVELDLALNELIEVPSEALNNQDGGASESLMSLSLRANKIEAIRTRAFHRLETLTKLDLSENHISAIEAGAFEGLKSLQRVYLHSNHLTTLSARDLPISLHGISVHENRWTCDCRLRSFRLWLTQSNVPRMVEPSCQGPRRLVGIHIQSLSLAEFACAPQLSPTSMYLTVPKGKNVSIVCRVASDPVSTITWYFNGQKIHSSDNENSNMNIYHPRTSESLPPNYNMPPERRPELHQRIRVIRHDDVRTGSGESRSELLIQQTSPNDNGTYYCEAVNKAASSVSNFTLHVTDSVDAPTILQLRLEYFIAVAVAVIVILILVLIVVAVLLVRMCKSRLEISGISTNSSAFSDKITSVNGSMTALQTSTVFNGSQTVVGNGKVAPVPTKMPKHIQMGTGFRAMAPLPPQPQPQQKPDLLTEAAERGRNSANTTMTSMGKADSSATASSASQGSYKMAMENIIEDYSGRSAGLKTPGSNGASPAAPLIGSSASRASAGLLLQANKQNSPAPHELPLQVSSLQFPSDYGLPLYTTLPRNSTNVNGTSNYSSLQPSFFPKVGGNMMPDEQYPTLPFRSPYIHTADSGPSAIVYYPQKTSTFQPIYESLSNRDIYSQVHKTPKNFPTSEELKNCDTDSAALDRLSQLLTSKEQSEVSVKTDLISLNVTTEEAAPMASQDESLSSSNQNSEAQNNNKVFQELDDAFTELDQEMAKDDLEDDEETKLSRIFSAPTAI